MRSIRVLSIYIYIYIYIYIRIYIYICMYMGLGACTHHTSFLPGRRSSRTEASSWLRLFLGDVLRSWALAVLWSYDLGVSENRGP